MLPGATVPEPGTVVVVEEVVWVLDDADLLVDEVTELVDDVAVLVALLVADEVVAPLVADEAVVVLCVPGDAVACDAPPADGDGDGQGVPLGELLGLDVPLPTGVGSALDVAQGVEEPAPPLGDSRNPAAVTKMMKMK